jgi:hypothetical protein
VHALLSDTTGIYLSLNAWSLIIDMHRINVGFLVGWTWKRGTGLVAWNYFAPDGSVFTDTEAAMQYEHQHLLQAGGADSGSAEIGVGVAPFTDARQGRSHRSNK